MLGQVLSLRLMETNSVCQRCAKLLHTHRTVNVRLKNNSSSRNSEQNQTRSRRKTESTVLLDCFGYQNHRLQYDSRSAVSLKLSKWPSSITACQRNYGGPVALSCCDHPLGKQYFHVNKHAFHTSSVHLDNDGGEDNPGVSGTTDSIQENSSNNKETNKSINDDDILENDVEILETDTETDVQSISETKSEDKDSMKEGRKRNQSTVVMEKTELMGKKVADIKSSIKSTVIEEQLQYDNEKQIKEFLTENDIVLKQGHTCFTTSCPKLGKILMNRLEKKEGERLFINSTSGYFLCEHCQKSGSWPILKDNISALKKVRKKKLYTCFENISLTEEPQTIPPDITALLQSAKDIKSLKREEFEDLIDAFDWQGIKQSTLTKFQAKYISAGDNHSILLPVTSVKGVVVGVRKFTASQKHSDEEDTHVRATSHPRQLSDVFGWQSVGAKSTSIVITGHEVESLAIIQNTGIPSIALKNLTYFPQELLPYLERFTKIILWFGNDVKAWQSSKQFAKKLNDIRCHVFRPSSDLPSALEVIQSEESLKDILLKARPIGHDSIVSFSKLRHEVYIELAQIEQVSGVKWKRYTPLNKILKGHRPGELTVLTGPTGSGKTTLVSDYSLDLCTQGVNTLWGSFEISNVRLAKVMMSQFAGKSMMKNLKCFDEVADQFSEIPMFFMTYFGQEEMHNVIQAMSHAVYVHDIKHVIVDNLQFMMGMNYAEGSRFHIQDKIISMFRNFATQMNCHVTLIIHPRKQNDGEELMMASIFGSAKAVQEADNVLILQDMRLSAASGRKYVQVMKNRFDGELGVMMLKFDKDSLRFVATQKKSASRHKDSAEERDELEEKETDSDDRRMSGSKGGEGEGMKFKKLDESGHSYDNILDIDKYYAS